MLSVQGRWDDKQVEVFFPDDNKYIWFTMSVAQHWLALHDAPSPESGSSSAVEGIGSPSPKTKGWFGDLFGGVVDALRSTPHALSEKVPRRRIGRRDSRSPKAPKEMVLFWRETGPYGELSNWHRCNVRSSINGQEYVYGSSEQLFMARKAAHFGDFRSVVLIKSPAGCQEFGKMPKQMPTQRTRRRRRRRRRKLLPFFGARWSRPLHSARDRRVTGALWLRLCICSRSVKVVRSARVGWLTRGFMIYFILIFSLT